MADPDLQLRGGGGGGIFPSVISSFFTQNKGGGGGPPGPSHRSATDLGSFNQNLGDPVQSDPSVVPPYGILNNDSSHKFIRSTVYLIYLITGCYLNTVSFKVVL